MEALPFFLLSDYPSSMYVKSTSCPYQAIIILLKNSGAVTLMAPLDGLVYFLCENVYFIYVLVYKLFIFRKGWLIA